MENKDLYKEILGKKRDIAKKIKRIKIKHLNEQDLEIIVFENLEKDAKLFPFKSDIKAREYFENKKVIEIIGKLNWSERENNEVDLIGAHPNISFKISQYLKDIFDDLISIEKGLGKITIRKHEKNIYYIENFSPLSDSKEENFKKVCKLREEFTIDEWKNILLGSLGYDLSDSKGITRDLLLVRLLPYVENNYNYIELGGKSTGKTTIAEKFTTGEKINANISAPNFLYNINTKNYGVLFSKDVLYLDESNFTSINKEIAPSLLQAKAGNKIEVRGKYDSRKTDVSFVSQGNIEAAEYQFKNRNLLHSFEKGFNNDAHFDRECFLIAGWLIPSYSKMALKEETLGIRLDVFEDYLKVLREKESYDDMIPDLRINLVGSSATGRFNDQIRKSISGFLKLFYPSKSFNIKEEKLIIDGVLLLSCFGKYLIQEGASDLGKKEYKNDYLEFSYRKSKKMKITRTNLEYLYVKNKEMKYFQEDILEEEDEEDIQLPWNVENEASIELKGNIEFKKERVCIPEDIQLIFNEIPETNKTEKEKLEDCYKAVEAYEESNKAQSDSVEYMKAYLVLKNYIIFISKLLEMHYKEKFLILTPLVELLLRQEIGKKEYAYHTEKSFLLADIEYGDNVEKHELENIKLRIKEIANSLESKALIYQRGLTGKLAFDDSRYKFKEALYKIENLKDNIVKLKFDCVDFQGIVTLKLKDSKNLFDYIFTGEIGTIDKNRQKKTQKLEEASQDIVQQSNISYESGIGGVIEVSNNKKLDLESHGYFKSISITPLEKFHEYFNKFNVSIVISSVETGKRINECSINIFDNRSDFEKMIVSKTP